MDRQRLVFEKTEELEQELEQWARSAGILAAGERLVFSLRIEQSGRLVRCDWADLEPFQISAQCRHKFNGTFLRPAELSSEATREILGRLPTGKVYKGAEALLLENGNAPTRLHIVAVHKMNQALKEPVCGKRYRVAPGKNAVGDYCAQLWEVREPEERASL